MIQTECIVALLEAGPVSEGPKGLPEGGKWEPIEILANESSA